MSPQEITQQLAHFTMFCEHNFSSSSSDSDWRVSNLFDRTDADWIWRSFRPIMLSLDLILLYLQKTHFWIQTIYLLNAISSGGEIFYPESSQKCIYTSSKFWFHLFSVQESNPAYSLVSYRIGISIHYVYFVLEVQLSLRWNAHNHKSGAFSHVLDDVCLPERMVHFRLLKFTWWEFIMKVVSGENCFKCPGGAPLVVMVLQ